MRRALLLLIPSLVAAFGAAAQTPVIPYRTYSNVIVGSYNIKWLGQEKHDFEKLASVIQHFDVCGVLEIRAEREMASLVAALENLTGKDWGYVYGIRTHNPSGTYYEAYGAVWRKDRVELGDGVVSNLWDPEEAFRNDPFIVSFRRRNFDFSLLLLHTRWSDDADGTRANEIIMIAEQILRMKKFLVERDLILAGDFNYPGSHPLMMAMADAADLIQLDADPKSTFKADYSDYANSYDHMYVLRGETTEYIPGTANTLDTTSVVYGVKTPETMAQSKKELSDHLPVFAIFSVWRPDDDF